MLKLVQITKDYPVAEGTVKALRGVSVAFRRNEFVAVLGASGCGKTTLLNIIGGLDHYTDGDLIIRGRSTKEYKDGDWDFYRNHSVGFVFQSYNLIPHQTVLANVELALTLSGISKNERRARAAEALQKVGLGDQLNKRPAQLSGGQMQRVAIARALVNDPDILLADEPTGALDSTTSVQIMEILKDISKERLIIMVTHNPELADAYANRIIRMKDGLLVDDSNPYSEEEQQAAVSADESTAAAPASQKTKKAKKQKQRISMSFFTALSLSFRNLMTKKTRTLLVSLAGSIGIIGIALILSVSTGVQAYIDSVEESTMSNYPLSIQATTFDMGGMLGSMMEEGEAVTDKAPNTVYSHNVMADMLKSLSAGIAKNDLVALKKYLQSGKTNISEYVNDIKYSYATGLNAYVALKDADGNISYRENIKDYYELFEKIGMGGYTGSSSSTMTSLYDTVASTSAAWNELVGSDEYIQTQYDILYGTYPTAPDEVVLVVNENGEISDYTLYMLGILDVKTLEAYYKASEEHRQDPDNKTAPDPLPIVSYTYETLCGYSFRLLTDADYYKVVGNMAMQKTEAEIKDSIQHGVEVKIVGVLKPSADAVSATTVGGIGYTDGFMPMLLQTVQNHPVVKLQEQNPTKDILTGLDFSDPYTLDDYDTLYAMLSANPQYAPLLSLVTNKQDLIDYVNEMLSSYDKNMAKFGCVSEDDPSAIHIYPKDFESKDAINAILDDFSKTNSKLTYTDTIALMLDSVTTIVNAISYVLVAFVAISLVVSSIMIGVITYISVLERNKEIGILRAMGASKRDVGRVFNAETLVIGFAAGALGILISLGLIVIINIILRALTGITTLTAVLSFGAAVILIAISMILTLISGLIPSGIAARRDPVVALRSE